MGRPVTESLELPPSPTLAKPRFSEREIKMGKSILKAFLALAIIGATIAGVGTAGHFALNDTISGHAFGLVALGGSVIGALTLFLLKKICKDLLLERRFAKNDQIIEELDQPFV